MGVLDSTCHEPCTPLSSPGIPVDIIQTPAGRHTRSIPEDHQKGRRRRREEEGNPERLGGYNHTYSEKKTRERDTRIRE